MGTNYYLLRNVCTHCNRPESKLHIGKNSAGWFFCFQGYDEEELQLHSLEDWLPLLNDPFNVIVDEYSNSPITTEDFINRIKNKQKNYNYELSRNEADAYSRVEHFDCYDVFYGDFS